MDVIEYPLIWEDRNSLIKSGLGARFMDLSRIKSRNPDLVIATRFPVYLMKHPRKIIWLFHQHRQVYELCGTEYSNIGFFREDLVLRQIIQSMDNAAFEEAVKVFAISGTIRERLKKFNDIDSNVLYPIPPNHNRYVCDKTDNYILSVARLEKIKRVDLLVKAMKNVPEDLKCMILGTGSQENQLRRLAADLGVEKRVIFKKIRE